MRTAAKCNVSGGFDACARSCKSWCNCGTTPPYPHGNNNLPRPDPAAFPPRRMLAQHLGTLCGWYKTWLHDEHLKIFKKSVCSISCRQCVAAAVLDVFSHPFLELHPITVWFKMSCPGCLCKKQEDMKWLWHSRYGEALNPGQSSIKHAILV